MIAATQQMNNNRDGNGSFKPLKRKRRVVKKATEPEFSYLKNTDFRMKFNQSKDPIYAAFDFLEKRTVAQLAGDFVKDTFFEITNFVSKVVK
ncbi:hypothetical protein KBA27_07015 [bacterium]|nr:hypothetical protein [bacterium]